MEPKNFIQSYIARFQEALNGIKAQVQGDDRLLSHAEGVEIAVAWIREAQANNNKLMFIGNGGSAGIASHQAIDYWKNGGVRAMAFNDPAQLTCLSNDCGYEQVFSMPIERFADAGDIAMCISSSGNSINIRNGVKAAKEKGCKTITFSGMAEDNPLRPLGDLNFYVPSFSYGYVEILHEFISHSILDAKMYCFDNRDIFHKNKVGIEASI